MLRADGHAAPCIGRLHEKASTLCQEGTSTMSVLQAVHGHGGCLIDARLTVLRQCSCAPAVTVCGALLGRLLPSCLFAFMKFDGHGTVKGARSRESRYPNFAGFISNVR